MIGTKVEVRHTSNGSGKLERSSRKSHDTITAVYSHRDEFGNLVVQLSNGEPYSITKTSKGWVTV